MEGAALRQKVQLDVSTYTAWHTAVFGLNGYSGKLKPLSDYLANDRKQPKRAILQRAEAIAFFHRMKERGFDVSITRH